MVNFTKAISYINFNAGGKRMRENGNRKKICEERIENFQIKKTINLQIQ